MPRRRKNDPAGLPSSPQLVTDPLRHAVILAEFQRKTRFLISNYHHSKKLGLDNASFNASLKRLKQAVGRRKRWDGPMVTVHPFIRIAVNIEARELANVPTTLPLRSEHGRFVQTAAANIARRSRLIRGSPGDVDARRYVEAFIALMQEATGKPFIAKRDKDSVYDPQLPGDMGRALRFFVDQLDPRIADPKVSYWARQLRKRYAGKPMRFADIFPVYGATVDEESGSLRLPLPYEAIESGLTNPIYCP